MKICPQCNTGFHDSHTTCPNHGGYLSEIIDLKAGMTIRDSYKIVRKLGEGGFGAVYLAEHRLMNEPRALKFLARQWNRDEGFVNRFRREVQSLRQIRHENVVDCGDLERAEDDSLFFSMEFVDGPDLREFLDKHSRPLDVRMALEIACGIALGLGAAHAKGLVHRDIKPENILMSWKNDHWTPKIADFGIVATKESSTTRATTTGSLLTWAYAAPEQWRGMRSAELDGRTDLYALGGVLYELLTGRTAFDAENYEGWMYQHLKATLEPPSLWNPDLANYQGTDELVLWMMRRDREERPADVASVLASLDSILNGKKAAHYAEHSDTSRRVRDLPDKATVGNSTINMGKIQNEELSTERNVKGLIIINHRNPSKGESVTVRLDNRTLVMSIFPMKCYCAPGQHKIRVNDASISISVSSRSEVLLEFEKGFWKSKLYRDE